MLCCVELSAAEPGVVAQASNALEEGTQHPWSSRGMRPAWDMWASV